MADGRRGLGGVCWSLTKQLRRGVFTSVLQLEQAIMDFIAGHNDQKNAFVWTKTAEVILEKVARARAAFI